MNDLFTRIKNKSPRIAVVGDVLLDEYRYGSADRLSPEFPVPILKSSKDLREYAPGGAANVAAQMTHFPSQVALFGIADNQFKSRIGKQPFLNTLTCFEQAKTPRKIRFYDGDFPLLRQDIEDENYGLNAEELSFCQWDVCRAFTKMVEEQGFDVVVFSDYHKGLFSNSLAKCLIAVCREHRIPTVVDPKMDIDLWQGCLVLKPNSREAALLSKQSDWRKQADYLLRNAGCMSVVITQQGSGVVGKHNDKYFEYRPLQKEVSPNSVIGAGDCFAAILALLLAHHVPIDEAAGMAFEAGAEYVKAKHNRPIFPYDLYRRLNPIDGKIITVGDLVEIKDQQRLVFTNGVFDLLHSSHLDLLNYAKSQGDKLAVAVNTDESVKRLKGPERPVNCLADRMKVLANLSAVDFVVSFSQDTPYEVIKQIAPAVIVKGGDYRPAEVVGVDLVENVRIFPYKNGYSSSLLIEKIKQISP